MLKQTMILLQEMAEFYNLISLLCGYICLKNYIGTFNGGCLQSYLFFPSKNVKYKLLPY